MPAERAACIAGRKADRHETNRLRSQSHDHFFHALAERPNLDIIADACRSDHAAIADQHQPTNPEVIQLQLAYLAGISRHGAPVRRTQKLPLTVRRLSENRRATPAPIGVQRIE